MFIIYKKKQILHLIQNNIFPKTYQMNRYMINDYEIIEYLLFFLVGCSSFNSKKQLGHQKRIFISNQMGNKKVKPS